MTKQKSNLKLKKDEREGAGIMKCTESAGNAVAVSSTKHTVTMI